MLIKISSEEGKMYYKNPILTYLKVRLNKSMFSFILVCFDIWSPLLTNYIAYINIIMVGLFLIASAIF